MKIIWNDKEGFWDKEGIKKVELVHELTISNENNDPNKDFYRIVIVVADGDDNIYINELFEGTIRKFNKNGEYLLTIGRKGQGPGEFNSPGLYIIFQDQ